MHNFLIKNLDDSEAFVNKLKTYWEDNVSLNYAKEIFNYYKIEENYQFIDTDLNNYRALSLALSYEDSDFLNLLLNSPEIKNKAYSLEDLGEVFALGSSHSIENVKLVITAFENKKEIFNDYNDKTENFFIRALMNVLLSEKFWISEKNERYFFDFAKRQNIKIYDNEYSIIKGLFNYGQIEILDKIIDNAPTDEDKLKILRKDLSGINIDDKTIKFIEEKKQEYFYKQYKNLDNELSSSIDTKKKKPKI